jgi:hypothetical protein
MSGVQLIEGSKRWERFIWNTLLRVSHVMAGLRL